MGLGLMCGCLNHPPRKGRHSRHTGWQAIRFGIVCGLAFFKNFCTTGGKLGSDPSRDKDNFASSSSRCHRGSDPISRPFSLCLCVLVVIHLRNRICENLYLAFYPFFFAGF